MKKWSVILLSLLLTFAFAGCRTETTVAETEYVLTGDKLADVSPEDNARVYYEIFVGAFSDSNGDGTGDLQGLTDRLDYLNDGDSASGKSLGIEGIWLMPIMRSPSYHKYDVIDYMTVDSSYGTLDDFDAFTAACAERGIDVIIDLVLNHTSNYCNWFKECKKSYQDNDLTNPYRDYYTVVAAADRVSGHAYTLLTGDYYYESNFSSSMPELNMDCEALRAEIVDIIQFWFDHGVHGFRLDAAKYVYLNDTAKNIEFWNWFMDEVLAIDPDAYVVGENWSADSQILPYYECFSNFDFGMAQAEGAVARAATESDSVNDYVAYLASYRSQVEAVNPEALLTPFVSNHDMDRAAGFLSVTDGTMQMAANLYILTYGTPFLYYGEEIGMKGSRGTANTDANRRLAMLWGDGDTVEDPVGATYDASRQTNGTVQDQLLDPGSLYNYYKGLLLLRNANPEIARGEYTPLEFSGYFSFGGFLATWNGSTVGVFHNTGTTPVTIDLSAYAGQAFSEIRGVAGMGDASLSGQTLTIAARTSVVIR